MCGRATYKLTWEEIVALYRLTPGAAGVEHQLPLQRLPPATIHTIVEPDGKVELVRMRWGVIRRGGRSRSRR
jgi:putative SOS response-associated peptidase YedK